MKSKAIRTGVLFGAFLFIELLPLSFKFSDHEAQILISMPFKNFTWMMQSLVLIILVATKPGLSKARCVALATICLLVPFTFTFNENGINFLLLNQYTSNILSWTTAIVLLSKQFIRTGTKELTKHY